jgi:hypothetical protein
MPDQHNVRLASGGGGHALVAKRAF